MDFGVGIRHEQGMVANAGPLGLSATAVANWAVGVRFLNWATADSSAGISVFYGGMAQFMAGLWCFRRNDTLGAFAFCTYGAWWLSIATFGLLFASHSSDFYQAWDNPVEVRTGLGWFLILIFIVNAYMLICSLQTNPITICNFFWLGLSELLLAIGQFKGQTVGEGCVKAGGAVQVVLAIFCIYASFALTWNDMYGKPVIPLGPRVLDFSKEEKST